MNYAKLLEINSFFIWHIFLEVDKTQDIPSKVWQTAGDAQDARAGGGNAKLLKMPTLFPKLLETKFSCFAKFSRMPISFSKLLEML